MASIQITVTGGACSEILQAGIVARARKLLRETHGLSNCQVAVDIAQPIPGEQGRFYVQLEAELQNSYIFVGVGQPRRAPDEDPSAAVRDAFAIMEQHIQQHGARRPDRATVVVP